MEAHEFEPMSIGRILDGTFNIYKNNFIRFITIVAIIQIPIVVLMFISTSILQTGIPSQPQEQSEFEPFSEQQVPQNPDFENQSGSGYNSMEVESNPAVFIIGSIGMIISGILNMLGHVLCRGALTKSVSESYLGNEITVGQAYRYIWPKFLTLIGAGILVVLAVYAGLILLVVPGIIFGLWFALTTPAIVIEDLKATEGMSRSKALVSGNLGKVFSIGFLVIIISWVIAMPFNYIGSLLGQIFFANNMMLMTFINQLSSVIGQILIVPIGAIAYILLYYDLRIRKEGFDLQMLANSINPEQGFINPKTGKVHTSFNQTVTATGRLSSTNPNLQNIPIREERGREIRKAFISSSPDNLLLAADYSQIELRLMAHMSQDTHMIEAFRNKEDIHTATAAKIHKVDIKDVGRAQRAQAKTANFGIIYGISAFGLSQRLDISRQEAKKLIDGYFESYPGVKKYMDDCIAKARDDGYVTTLMGRKRFLADINSKNTTVRGFAERNAINSPIQGTAADIIKKAMIAICREIRDRNLSSRMILQVHDELIFDVPGEEIEEMKTLVKQEMENACLLDVPIVVEMGTGNNWLEAH